MPRVVAALAIASALVSSTSADPTDWVNVKYFAAQVNAHRDPSTRSAEAAIIRGANAANKAGPYYALNAKGVAAPSEDPHDYLSWAPYHWPNCNWCGDTAPKYYSPNQNDTSDPGDEGTTPDQNSHPDYQTGDPDFDDDPSAWQDDYSDQSIADISQHGLASLGRRRHRMVRKKRQATTSSDTAPQATEDTVPDPTAPLSFPTSLALVSSTTTYPVAGTNAPAQAAAKPNKSKAKGTQNSKCTPSPTTSMAPSATWTTCPYAIRDGKVNPDVRTLRGPGAINKSTQQIIYNMMAYIYTSSNNYVSSLVEAMDAFYLDSKTAMNPNMNYGQVARGPGPEGKEGTFTGIIDGRGNVKTMNGYMLLKAINHPSWTKDLDKQMKSWISKYNDWCTNSDIGKKTLSRPNNHGSFFAAQMAATKLAIGDVAGAKALITNFMDQPFQDQIAASGEQPFEAIRTRPFHYRCFNLEALIVIAKIAEEIGLDVWSRKTKYGSTIQTAVDYVMKINPKNEDVGELVPHVVSIQRAYGDPQGRYAKFLAKTMPSYQGKPFYLYNTSPAFSKASRRNVVMKRDDLPEDPNLTFTCPSIFQVEEETELEDGLFVTCKMVQPFFLSDIPLE